MAALWVCTGVAGSAAAQTTDPIFRSWRWTEEVTSARALGLGGAVTGLADDGAAAAFNPAGLATIPAAGELQLGLRLSSDRTLANGDRLHQYTKTASPATFVVRVSPRIALSYHFVERRTGQRLDFEQGPESGRLRTAVNGPGLGIGVRATSFVKLGLSLDALRFYINSGGYQRTTDAGSSDLTVRFLSNGETRVAATLGALVDARELTFGLAYRMGSRWGALRMATDPSSERVLDDGSSFSVRSPSVLSGGLSWRPELRRAQTLLLTAQVDRVWLGSLRPTAAPGLAASADDYRMDDAFEWRVGSEMTLPFPGRWLRHNPGSPNRIQLRAGWHHAAAGVLVYSGSDPQQTSLFPRVSARNLWSVGLSVGSTTIWRLSGACRFGDDDKAVVVGLAIRYPGLFP